MFDTSWMYSSFQAVNRMTGTRSCGGEGRAGSDRLCCVRYVNLGLFLLLTSHACVCIERRRRFQALQEERDALGHSV